MLGDTGDYLHSLGAALRTSREVLFENSGHKLRPVQVAAGLLVTTTGILDAAIGSSLGHNERAQTSVGGKAAVMANQVHPRRGD